MDSCYKLRQLFYYKVRHGLLQIATGITKCDDYYKLRQYTHSCDFWGEGLVILKKNDFQTVQEWNQAYIDRFIGQENKFFPNKKKTGPTYNTSIL